MADRRVMYNINDQHIVLGYMWYLGTRGQITNLKLYLIWTDHFRPKLNGSTSLQEVAEKFCMR